MSSVAVTPPFPAAAHTPAFMDQSPQGSFLADRTARSMIYYWHDTVVCPSVCMMSVCDH